MSEEFVVVQVKIKKNMFGGTDATYEMIESSENLSDDFRGMVYDDHSIDLDDL